MKASAMSTAASPHPHQPLIGSGPVRHRRLRPTVHAFSYRAMFLLLPMRSLARDPALLPIARNRFGAMSFFDADHGDGGSDSLAWLQSLLAAQGILDADGEIWLQTFPRIWGYVFKPVSLWLCERADGSLRCAVAEVNNTFGERHCYILTPPAGERSLQWGAEYRASKVFHVSPFCTVEGGYRFRFMRSTGAGTDRMLLRIDHDDAQGPLIETSISGVLQPLTAARARVALLRHPMHSFGVIARIHWQAFKLWRKRVPFHSKPLPPDHFASRS
ncbi:MULTISPECIES: DUF1365 domain-containing protein [unclassified Thiomonas]|jgi:DUF1365 family protein|uniref:DUF1365 domain-containing protein n=1 Tax=unclassified Thiomonas TaxID=2625466 RepID=UPI0004DBB225|nr:MULTISPECIES: DUF1365 domain-containing protein [unclassified Thiomonas]MDD5001147.1 DUF1365 domain-containing protein [Thiomonas arsenitoxydans]CDW94291.1 conserved hypothetical protein [Thiomonas sp. CB2]VDY04400.1 conserved protein of unknown function [Thiomonas sp. Bio17B3]VDY08429.1 conserved protein of unknown function [Thiomonas sp. Sup16B3]VDY12651.1 conserved hypothetical protein [Thiomonas sp. OC7]